VNIKIMALSDTKSNLVVRYQQIYDCRFQGTGR
jgi:hypothetical protein